MSDDGEGDGVKKVKIGNNTFEVDPKNYVHSLVPTEVKLQKKNTFTMPHS